MWYIIYRSTYSCILICICKYKYIYIFELIYSYLSSRWHPQPYVYDWVSRQYFFDQFWWFLDYSMIWKEGSGRQLWTDNVVNGDFRGALNKFSPKFGDLPGGHVRQNRWTIWQEIGEHQVFLPAPEHWLMTDDHADMKSHSFIPAEAMV